MFNIQVLEKFLLCGPTLQNVIIPHKLWKLFIKINQSLTSQNSAVKLLLQAAQKPKVRQNIFFHINDCRNLSRINF